MFSKELFRGHYKVWMVLKTSVTWFWQKKILMLLFLKKYFNSGSNLHVSAVHSHWFCYKHTSAVGNVDSWIAHTITLYYITYIYIYIVLHYIRVEFARFRIWLLSHLPWCDNKGHSTWYALWCLSAMLS